ncbi:TIGR01440 family protein [Bacillus sp. RO1]|uniref:TIGR01440 family protein n=1 Tax=Bacillus sp. RO1 TaxID=2722703 RepID=UPI0014570F95|nr:TIGR01440 family protein [Bacillus sp. RO1]NLP51778.1 TIGR01440 family protein [Bacillus sp. RO1]
MMHLEWKEQLQQMLNDLQDQAGLKKGQILVVGCSTSEVIGEKIGTAGTEGVAETLFAVLNEFRNKTGVDLAFQCCEHLNRALVVERETACRRGLDEVTVIPVRHAGGAMASYAYHKMEDAVMVEHIKADAGIDIGDTLIGMHLKHVAVPVRSSVKSIGNAHITMAKTRPKLIGGARATYEIPTTETK